MDLNRARRFAHASARAVLTEIAKSGAVKSGAVKAEPAKLSDAQFAHAQVMLFDYAGIKMAAGKKQLVENRLGRQLRLTAFTDFGAYLSAAAKQPALKQGFISALTTNVTSFYREAHHFDVLSLAIKRKAAQPESSGYIPRVWSAGCSTGEEAISILFTVLESLPEAQVTSLLIKGQAIILATDIDLAVLATATVAAYSEVQVRAVPAKWLARAFEVSDDQIYRLRNEFKALIKFHPLNLNAPHWMFPINFGSTQFDAIFCRNVMIYFNAYVQRNLLLKFVPCLHAHSLFFSGHSEMLLHSADLFESLGSTAYKRKSIPYTAHLA